MNYSNYKAIKETLECLNRREQYPLLLKTAEWWAFRLKILLLGQNKCQNCGIFEGTIEEEIPYDVWKLEYEKVTEHNKSWKKRYKENPSLQFTDIKNGIIVGEQPIPLKTKEIGYTILQAHHKLYFWDRLPWEYSAKDLIPLCVPCHTAEHLKNHIIMYKDGTMKFQKKDTYCRKCEGTGYIPEFDYWKDGICFDCGGLGYIYNESDLWEEVMP